MSGINKAVIFAVTRLKVRFEDGLNAPIAISGTGFWIKSNRNKQLLITNKHNLDPKLKLGSATRYSLTHVEVQLRKIGLNQHFEETEFVPISNVANCIKFSSNADCAIIVEPQYVNRPVDYSHNNIMQNDIAEQSLLNDKVQMMDIASFVGFPGDNRTEWWDQRWNLPVARLVNISSWPSIPYTNVDVITADTMLVSGLSFSGSSGSPLFLHQKGLKPTTGDIIINDDNYVEPKILGIMSGHWWLDEANTPQLFKRHSGLSYVTRSTSILDLINQYSL